MFVNTIINHIISENMKKLLILSFATCAMMMASCGNKTQNAISLADSDSLLMDTSIVAAVAANGLSEDMKATITNITTQLTKDIKQNNTQNIIVGLANLETIYRNLAAASKLEDAKVYGSAIKKFINSNKEALSASVSENATIGSLVQSIQNLPTTAETTADQAKAAVANDIATLASPAIAKGETAVATAEAAAKLISNAPAAAKTAATNAATSIENNTKEAVNNQVDAAKASADKAVSNAKDKTNKAITDTKDKANKKVNEAAEKANKKINDATKEAIKGLGL